MPWNHKLFLCLKLFSPNLYLGFVKVNIYTLIFNNIYVIKALPSHIYYFIFMDLIKNESR